MSKYAQILQDLHTKTKRQLKLELSQVQNELYKNGAKSQIITQIRLNLIVEAELSQLRGMEVGYE